MTGNSIPPAEEARDLLKRALAFVISLVVLAIIHAIATRLPGTGIWVLPRYGITISNLVGAGIGVGAIVVVWRFAQEAGPRLAKIFPYIPEVTPLLSNTCGKLLSLMAAMAH